MTAIRSAPPLRNSHKLSSWDEEPASVAATSNVNDGISKLQWQFIGVIVVLLTVLTFCVTVTIVFTSTTTTSSTTSTSATTVTQNPYACGSMIILNYTDFPGNDIAPSLAMNYTDCCNFCLNTSSCIAFTWLFNSNICYRKNSLGGGPVSLFNVISGRY